MSMTQAKFIREEEIYEDAVAVYRKILLLTEKADKAFGKSRERYLKARRQYTLKKED